eukprot:2979253-Pleurochrysis_carterae.AAC.1
MPQEQSSPPPSDASESADAFFATHDVAAENPTATPVATDENADVTIAVVPDTAAEAPVAAAGAADENAGTPTATLGTAVETT